jgi:hypothetical protein
MTPRPRLVERPAADSGAEVLRCVRELVMLAVPELRGLERGACDLVDVAAAVPASRRVLFRACRDGAIVGASRVGRRWLAPRSSIDEWLRSRGPRLVPAAPADDDDDELEALRQSLARPDRRPRRGRS